jgi:transcriptional regulator with XRE-family HTH domain
MPKKAPVINVSPDFGKKLGGLIENERRDAKINRTEFASSLGVSRASLLKWESGERLPESHVLALICRLLGLDPNPLLGLSPGIDSAKINARIRQLVKAEGEEKLKGTLGTETGELDDILLDGRLVFSMKGLGEIASAYGISLNWLITGAPEHWTPHFPSGVRERLRFFRICNGIDSSLTEGLEVKQSEKGLPKIIMKGAPFIDVDGLLMALAGTKEGTTDFPFDIAWIATGES